MQAQPNTMPYHPLSCNSSLAAALLELFGYCEYSTLIAEALSSQDRQTGEVKVVEVLVS